MHFRYLLYTTVFHNLCFDFTPIWCHSSTITSMSQGQELLFIFGCRTENVQREEEERGTLTAWGLVVLVIWEEVVQSLLAGVRVFLLLRGERGRGVVKRDTVR